MLIENLEIAFSQDRDGGDAKTMSDIMDYQEESFKKLIAPMKSWNTDFNKRFSFLFLSWFDCINGRQLTLENEKNIVALIEQGFNYFRSFNEGRNLLFFLLKHKVDAAFYALTLQAKKNGELKKLLLVTSGERYNKIRTSSSIRGLLRGLHKENNRSKIEKNGVRSVSSEEEGSVHTKKKQKTQPMAKTAEPLNIQGLKSFLTSLNSLGAERRRQLKHLKQRRANLEREIAFYEKPTSHQMIIEEPATTGIASPDTKSVVSLTDTVGFEAAGQSKSCLEAVLKNIFPEASLETRQAFLSSFFDESKKTMLGKVFAEKGLRGYNVESDGSCLPNALIDQLNFANNVERKIDHEKACICFTEDTKKRAKLLRDMFLAEVTAYSTLYPALLDNEAKAMATRGHCNDIFVRAIVNAYARQGLYYAVAIIDERGRATVIRAPGATTTLIVGHYMINVATDVGHYWSLTPIEMLQRGQATPELIKGNPWLELTEALRSSESDLEKIVGCFRRIYDDARGGDDDIAAYLMQLFDISPKTSAHKTELVGLLIVAEERVRMRNSEALRQAINTVIGLSAFSSQSSTLFAVSSSSTSASLCRAPTC